VTLQYLESLEVRFVDSAMRCHVIESYAKERSLPERKQFCRRSSISDSTNLSTSPMKIAREGQPLHRTIIVML
jgi:hypothetical protein